MNMLIKDLHIKISEEYFNILKNLAEKKSRTTSNLARLAIEQYLKKHKWNRGV